MKLEELEERLIGAARRELAPSEADRQRHTAALLRGDRARPPAAAARPKPVSSGWGGFSALSLGLLLGALAGGGAGFAWGHRLGSAAPATAAPPLPVELSAGEQVAELEPLALDGLKRDETPSASAQTPEPAEREVEGAPAPLADAAPNTRPMRSAAPRSAATGQPPSPTSVSVELAMLQRARRALNANNGRLALGLVQELDERFPSGLLMEERQATRVLSLCELGRTVEAKQAAFEFEQRYASSVYGERVRQSCAADREE